MQNSRYYIVRNCNILIRAAWKRSPHGLIIVIIVIIIIIIIIIVIIIIKCNVT